MDKILWQIINDEVTQAERMSVKPVLEYDPKRLAALKAGMPGLYKRIPNCILDSTRLESSWESPIFKGLFLCLGVLKFQKKRAWP